MDQLLTTIIQTSPIPSHPSTALLEALFRSFQLVDGLLESRIVIVCDGCEEALPGEKENNKHGKASSETAHNYRLHLDRLREAVANQKAPFVPILDGSIELLELPERHGSACAIEAAFVRYNKVQTPFVMICQHDNFFVQNVPLRSCLEIMHRNPTGLGTTIGLKCLHFMATATLDYKNKVRKRYNINIEEQVVDGMQGCKLIPLVFWYGRTHVAYTEYYTNEVLNRPLKTGDHLEELLGVNQLNDIRQRGMGAHSDYGNFVLDQGIGEVIYHLSGRRVRAASSNSKLPSSTGRGENLDNDDMPRLLAGHTTATSTPNANQSEGISGEETTPSFTTARSCRAVVPGLEIIPPERNQKTRQARRFKQKCFHCGEKGHSYKWCPKMKDLPVTETIDLS